MRLLQLIVFSFLVLLGLWGVNSPVFSAPVTSVSEVTRLEQQLFSRHYNGETVETRLDRIESVVFGSPNSTQPVEVRLQAIGQFLGNKPTSSPSTTQSEAQKKRPVQSTSPIVASQSPGESRYPTVTQMEEQVFHQVFEQEPVETRLSRLETKVLGGAQKGSLQDRSDRLQAIVMQSMSPSASTGTPLSQSSDAWNDTAYKSQPYTPTPPSTPQANTGDFAQAITPVEQRILRQTYPQDEAGVRLDRIEMKLFGKTAHELTPEDRLYRIVGVASAQRSADLEQGSRNPYGYGSRSNASGSMGTFGSMLLMIIMSLL